MMLVVLIPSMLLAAEKKAKLYAGMNILHHADGQRYFLYVPEKVLEDPEGARLLVSVHGTGGRYGTAYGSASAKDIAELWIDLAREQGWVVLAPKFDAERFGLYQTLNMHSGKGVRSDLRLNELIDQVGRMLPGIDTEKIFLFGFSGGGQFTHRYCLFHSQKVDRAVASSAGWYTWPRQSLPYPAGMDTAALATGEKPDFLALAGTKLLVLVGKSDQRYAEPRDEWEGIDLRKLQGKTRLERGRKWVAAVGGYVITQGVLSQVRFKTVIGADHSITKRLRRAVEDWFTEEE